MNLFFFRKNLPATIQGNVSIFDSIETANEYKIDFDVYLPSIGKNLQREFVWTLAQKQELIFSLLKGIKLPNIACIVDRRNNIVQVIDGKQRLSTLIAFVAGEFSIMVDGVEYFYKDLPADCKEVINYPALYADAIYTRGDLNPISDMDKINWFMQINFSGTPQDLAHLESLK